ncbi:MAG: substrate-binding domain-containing protein [Acholeplasmataceae bacterium]|nr:substrate-binding domain-containing protein [Acholeplasmataceae bacterium]
MKKSIVSILVLVLGFILVGCNNNETEEQKITVYTRDTTSGTRGAFFDIIGLSELGSSNEKLVEGFVEAPNNGEMMASIRNDKNGIGYISLSGLASSNLKGLSFNNVEASETNVLSGDYELKRPFMYIRKAEADLQTLIEKQLVDAFIAFMNSKDGKEIIANNDGIVEGLNSAPTWDNIKDDHAEALATGAAVEIHFGGSTSVEKIGRALSEAFSSLAPRFKPMHSHSGSGAAYSGTRSDGNLHLGFASRELKEEEKVTGNYDRVAWDAVVIVVNKENELTNITTSQIKDIYLGELKNWNDLNS